MRTANVLIKETKKYTLRAGMTGNKTKKTMIFTMAGEILSHLQ